MLNGGLHEVAEASGAKLEVTQSFGSLLHCRCRADAFIESTVVIQCNHQCHLTSLECTSMYLTHYFIQECICQ